MSHGDAPQHYVRLYIYAFSFQAHMQRVQTRNASLGVKGPINYFPSGLMGCSDARYILEAIDAAVGLFALDLVFQANVFIA